MFPGFVHIDKDTNAFVHLYFYPGIDETGNALYKELDLSNVPFTYTCTNKNGLYDYKFENKSIIKIRCQLVNMLNGEIENKTISLKTNK